MVDYRVYFIDDDGHFQKARNLECADDSAVIAEAKKLLDDDHNVEVWHLNRMVIRLDREK